MQANPRVDHLRTMLEMTLRQAGLGERIRQARKERGWKQKHLAAEVHVEPVTVSRWERGVNAPDFETLEVIALATHKPLSFFVREENEEREIRDLQAQRHDEILARFDHLDEQLRVIATETARQRSV